MSDKKLSILGISAVILAGLAILQSRLAVAPETTILQNSPLITGMDVESIAAVEIVSQKGASKLKLARKDGKFVVLDKDAYPARTKSVNDLLTACLEIRVAELQSKDPAFHSELGVTEQTAQYAVSFLDQQGQSLLTLYVSDAKPDSEGCFVRLGSSDRTYLSLGSPWIRTGPMDYINTELLNITSDKISAVVADCSGQSYTLKAGSEQGKIEMENIPAGKRFKGTAYQQVFNALNSLTFEDVLAKSQQTSDIGFDCRYICRLADSTVYTLNLGKKDGKTYLAVSAEFADKADVMKEKSVESEEQLKVKEAKLLARDAAAEFAQKHAGWIYVLPEYKARNLMLPLDEILEDIPAEEEKAVSSDA